jgi:glycosyltransferase involved in cell wall biosynthesis
VGRLIPQKDYPTLINAFSILRRTKKARLVILGEGNERSQLESMIRELGVTEDTRLLGFRENPYTYMARAAVFVLSSVSEGLATVVIEALACGIPVVSTNCRYGPAEILENGKYGRLVPVGNPDALAEAIQSALTVDVDTVNGRNRAKDFELIAIARQYLNIMMHDFPTEPGADKESIG